MRKDRVYVRGGVLWIDVTLKDGRRIQRSAGVPVGHEREARALLATLKAGAEAVARVGDPITGKATLRSFADSWLKERVALGIVSARVERSQLVHNVFPTLGDKALTEITTGDVRSLVLMLRTKLSRKKKPLAPRMIRHAFNTLRMVMHDAARRPSCSSPMTGSTRTAGSSTRSGCSPACARERWRLSAGWTTTRP